MNAVNSAPNVPFVVAYVPQALLPELDKLMQQFAEHCHHDGTTVGGEEAAPAIHTASRPESSAPQEMYEEATEGDAQALFHPPVVETPAEQRASRRGRIPGRYRFTGKKLNEAQLTEKSRAVYRLMQARRRGLTATKVQKRLGFAQGTVGWALAELKKVGAIEYIPAKVVKARAAVGKRPAAVV